MRNSSCVLNKFMKRTKLNNLTYLEKYTILYNYWENFASLRKYVVKIPFISYHIWLTNINKSKEMRESDIENLKNSLTVMDRNTEVTWQHILWTNCKSCIPETIKKLNLSNIVIKNIKTIKNELISYDTVVKLIYDYKYGMAVDILRDDLVKLLGTFYTDLNYILNKSPEDLMKKVDFFADAPSDLNIENYMFGAIPNHPIIIHSLEHSLSLIKNPSQLYSDLSGCSNDYLTEFFTYQPFVEAYIANANRYNTVDIAIPQKLEEQEDFDTLDEGIT